MFAGIACGTGAAVFWAVGFVAARHAIALGFWPSELVLHRFIWAGIVFLPVIARLGWVNFGGVGWGRSALLTVTGGPPLAHLSYAGFLFVPLAHGGVIQPSCAALGGLLLARIVLKERLSVQRAVGAVSIVAGLCVIGSEALASIGSYGALGDLAFVSAGSLFAGFATMLRLWRIAPMRAAAVTGVMALLEAPIHWLLFGFEHLIELGLFENLVQALAQGLFAGPGAIYLFTRSVVLLGAGRAAVFPSLVPGFTLLIGWLVLGELPTLIQLLGFGIVLIGFQLTQRG
jgi:drug/metabolite transporter (DMT)-like permease